MAQTLFELTGVALCCVFIGVVNPINLSGGQSGLQHQKGPCTTFAALSDRGGVHSAQVDTPCVVDLTHASPDNWGTLPPAVDVFERHPADVHPVYKHEPRDLIFGAITLAQGSSAGAQ
jgi:hypothetical protein